MQDSILIGEDSLPDLTVSQSANHVNGMIYIVLLDCASESQIARLSPSIMEAVVERV